MSCVAFWGKKNFSPKFAINTKLNPSTSDMKKLAGMMWSPFTITFQQTSVFATLVMYFMTFHLTYQTSLSILQLNYMSFPDPPLPKFI